MTTTSLAPSTVLESTAWCVCRPQQDRYLIYNSRTDELHLVTPFGFYLYRLCDGMNTITEIQQYVADLTDDPEVAPARMAAFLGDLVDRGILEVFDD
jgi:Coenzyme PQQ synthesis protein D (PqqD)